MDIKANIDGIRERISEAAKKVNKRAEDITLIGVTKTVDYERANEALTCGVNNLGENRVQEFLNKYEKMDNSKINWHIIGHLQTNKVKYVVDKNCLIHSLESTELAKELEKRSKQHNVVSRVLVEVNVAEEDSKFGIKYEKIVDFLREIEYFEYIRILGLMTVAPFEENPEDVRWVFKKMKSAFDNIKKMNFKNVDMKYLSMGMTNDFEVAIEEGANIVRIGTAIFGSRIYK